VLPYSRGFGGCCLLPRVRRVLAGTEGSPSVGYYREFGGCCLTLEGSAGVAYYRGCAGCWLAPRVRRVLATTVSSAGVALLSRVRRVLPTTEGAPGVGCHRGFTGCWPLLSTRVVSARVLLTTWVGVAQRHTLGRRRVIQLITGQHGASASSKRRIIDWATTCDLAQQPGSTVPAPQAKGESLTGR